MDADPDRPEYGGERYDSPDKLTWRTLPETAARFSELRNELSNQGHAPRLTWFMRCDLQIQKIHGDAAWSLTNFETMWKRLSNEGDELAWHPHAWRWSQETKCWYNEIEDTDYIIKSFNVGFAAFKRTMGFAPAATRAGVNFHNSRTLSELSDLGVKADLSAHPRLKLFYARREVGNPMTQGYDWSRTGPDPYHPSRHDYQTPDGNGLTLIEIPVTTWSRRPDEPQFWTGLVPVRFEKGIRIVRPVFKGWFVPDISGDSHRFQLAFNQVLHKASSRGLAHFSSAFHPDDITPSNFQRLKKNLNYAIEMARRNDIALESVTATQAAQVFMNA